MQKNNRKGKDKKTKVLNLNLSATMMVAGAILFVILTVVAVRIIATTISANSQKAMTEEETQGYTMVDSTDIDEEGNVIDVQVPVPEGFSASQVPGETTVNGGFVIYEGEVDWRKIEDLDSYAEVEATAEEVETQAEDANSEQADLSENSQEASQENVISEENGIPQEQIDEENSQEEEIDTEQIDNTEENAEELEQANNDIINEEEQITNEEAGISTMSENEANTEVATLAERETPTTVFELQTSRNQYVWVPVKDVSRIYGVDSNGKLWGKLYDFAREPGSTLSRSPNWNESNGIMSKPSIYSYREPDVLPNYSSYLPYDTDSKLQSNRDGMKQYQMLSQEMEESFYETIESIKKYGGYYIGRYETGDLSQLYRLQSLSWWQLLL